MNKTIVCIPVYNEEERITNLLKKFELVKDPLYDKVVIINDSSSDKTLQKMQLYLKKDGLKTKFHIINHSTNCGVGAAIRTGIQYAIDHDYRIIAIIAGNGKDDPRQLYKIILPVKNRGFDYIQGSRFLLGGSFKNLPLPRKLMIIGFSFIVYVASGKWVTDATNGFRAYKLDIFKDSRININQNWLNKYELEIYIHFKILTLGYKFKEVAVSKDYLVGVKNYSKIKPFIDWWRFIKPIVYLSLKIRS